MRHFLAILGGHATWVLFGGVLIGLILPDLASMARPLLVPSVALMLLLTMLRIDWHLIVHYGRRYVLLIVSLIWILGTTPVLVWAALWFDGLPTELASAIILMAAAPPIVGSASIALFLRLESELALVITVLATFIAPITLPPAGLTLIGLEIGFDSWAFMARLLGIIGFASLGAFILLRWFGRERIVSHGQRIDGGIVALMLVFAIAIMDGVTETLLSDPGKIALWIAAAFFANILLQGAGLIGFLWSGRNQAATVALLSGNRNMGLVLAALPPGAPQDIFLFFALAQLPIYMLPIILKSVYKSLTNRM